MDNKEIGKIFDFCYDNFTGNKRKEAFKVLTGKATKNEENKFYKSEFARVLVKTKFYIRKTIESMDKLHEMKTDLRRHKNLLCKNNMEFEMRDTELNYYLKQCRKQLGNYGKSVYESLQAYEEFATIDDFAQICNANAITVKNAVSEHLKNEGKAPSFVDLIFIYHIEDHKNDDFIENDIENCFFTAIEEALMHLLDTNKDAKKQVEDKMFETFPKLKDAMINVYTDSEGRVVSIDKPNKK